MAYETTQVNYEVIDHCIRNINECLNDPYIQIELGKMQQIFAYSNGDSAIELQEALKDLTDTYQIIQSMMLETKDMLAVVKGLFQNADLDTGNILRGGQ